MKIKSVSCIARSQRDGLLTEEMTMPALGEVMGGTISPQLADTIWSSVGVQRAPHIENKFTFSQGRLHSTLLLHC